MPRASRRGIAWSSAPGAVFDAVDAIVSHRVSQSWNRSARERVIADDLRKRFAGALVDFARELEHVRRR